MGRKKKYLTEEDKHEAEKRWMMEHYERKITLLFSCLLILSVFNLIESRSISRIMPCFNKWFS